MTTLDSILQLWRGFIYLLSGVLNLNCPNKIKLTKYGASNSILVGFTAVIFQTFTL